MACVLKDCLNKDKCDTCVRSATMRDHYMSYVPTCPYGYTDCVLDPAYTKKTSPDWYKEMHGDTKPEDVICECKDGNNYDDEDK